MPSADHDPFATFRREAFRLEALPQYLVEPEASMFRQWQIDGLLPEVHPDPSWLDTVRAAKSRGAVCRRVRAYTVPMSAYVAFELPSYRFNVVPEYAEDVRVLELAQPIDHADFWLFDDEEALVLRYDDEGHFLQANAVTDSSAVDALIEHKRDLLAASRAWSLTLPPRPNAHHPR